MFNRYWRDYPWFMQAMLLGLMLFTFSSFSIIASSQIVKGVYGVTPDQLRAITIDSPQVLVSAGMLFQVLMAMGIFVIPAICFAHVTHPQKWNYLGLKKPGKPIQWILSVLVILSALPLSLEIAAVLKHVNFGRTLNEMQSQEEAIQKAFINKSAFLYVLFVFAILPAVGEELLFRGVVFRIIYKRNNKLLLSAIISAILFALLHGSPYNYLSIFLAGVLLCYIYYLTGSLWCNIAAHMFYNGVQVCMVQLAKGNKAMEKIAENNSVPIVVLIISMALFLGFMYLLNKNKTPLGKNWTNDYSNEEMDAIAKSENPNEEQE